MWPFKKKTKAPTYRPNPHLNQKAGFFSQDSERLLSGWETSSYSIDHYLKSELVKIRARSRRMVRVNPYGKRFVEIMKSNIVGPSGVQVSAQRVTSKGRPDKRSNDAVEKAFKDWCDNHCDFFGRSSFVDLQNMAIACAAQDGEFFFEKVQAGKYGFKLKAIDAELLDIDKHEETRNGQIRMGVEYDREGRVIRYHFKEKSHQGDYRQGRSFTIRADRVIHGFISLYPDQSRGIPWMHASLEEAKHLEKYQEGAIVNARASANTFNVLSSEPGDEYTGDEQKSDYVSLDNVAPGSTVDIGNRKLINVDPSYPHQMYDAFVKANLRSVASGWGISYHSLSNDLEGVNYSSIRAGVLEDRELFKLIQNWLVRVLIKPVFEEWVGMAYLNGQIVLPGGHPVSGPVESYEKASYQARRWAWVDPQKDMASNKIYIDEKLKSRSQIMREQGDDPESVWAEIAREQELMKSLGIKPATEESQQEQVTEDE